MNRLEYNRWNIQQFIKIIDKVIKAVKSSWTGRKQMKGTYEEYDRLG